MNKISNEIRQMTIQMENGPVSSQKVYRLFMLSMLEIDKLEHEIKFIKDKNEQV